jgi:hypothetical protein
MIRLTSRVSPSVGLVVVGLLIGTAGAQAPAPVQPQARPTPLSASAIPKTPAGEALRAWLDAFNSGDSATIASYVRSSGSDLSMDFLLGFRRRTGGFDLLSIERSEPRRIEFYIGERSGPTTAMGDLEVPLTGPHRVTGPRLQALGPNAPAVSTRIDAATRARVVDRAAALLDSFYVLPDVAKRMGDSVRARLARGAYDEYDSGMSFAARLDDDLGTIAHDKHLGLRYSPRAMPARPSTGAPPGPTADEIARQRRDLEEDNCAFQKVERLEGNVGYLKFDAFLDADICAPTIVAAMTFVSGTRALIIDLRQNGGGSPKTVALVASYLFDRRTHLNDLWTRSTDSTEQFWTRDTLSGRRFGGEKPVFVLTSSRTFSGGEEFTYDLKTLKRATIVGETTGGGAHPVRGRRIDDHFMIGVPFARAINPITHTNWEGVGVEPDVKVPAADALAEALKLVGPARQ